MSVSLIFYDFEVFKHDWLAVFIDYVEEKKHVIINDADALKSLYEQNQRGIWVGFNNKHYDQYIMKAIMLGFDPKKINDYIIVDGGEGWKFSTAFNDIPMINYDVMPSNNEGMKFVGLKTMEAFMGSDIRETSVPFDVDRKLTQTEISETVKYCSHDVEQAMKVFFEKINDFNAMRGIVDAFPKMVNLSNIGDTEARITARVLGCRKRSFKDEFDYYFLPCIRLEKYHCVMDWFAEKRNEAISLNLQKDATAKKAWYKAQSYTITVAGIPHTFGFGGLHGAPDHPVHITGALYHVDVNNYYPSMLIAWDLVTRAATNDNYTVVYKTRKELKAKQQAAKTKDEAKRWKKAQLPYKKMLNALSGAMKDVYNPAYDPRNNNLMCINGQLMLLDLIEHLEVIPGFQLIQSNTDGLIVKIPDTDEAFRMLDDICWEWECRCSTKKCDILLALDSLTEIYQKDVNNYLWVDADGGVERIGLYLKELSPIDNDLPILNKALVEYMAHKVPVEKTIMECNDFIMFQKVVKLSAKYQYVEHEHCQPAIVRTGKRKIQEHYEYPVTVKYHNKSYRVFASNDIRDGRLLKNKGKGRAGEKFGNTPDHCFVWNESVEGVSVPEKLDRQWYINFANKRLKDFGIEV